MAGVTASISGHLPSAGRRLDVLLAIIFLVCAGIVWGVVGIQSLRSFDMARQLAERESLLRAQLIRAHAETTFQSLQQLLSQLALLPAPAEGGLSAEAWSDAARSVYERFTVGIDAICRYDASGSLQVGDGFWADCASTLEDPGIAAPAGADEYFLIGRPFRPDGATRPVLPLSVNLPAASPVGGPQAGGRLTIYFAPENLAAFYLSLEGSLADTVQLVRDDGILLAVNDLAGDGLGAPLPASFDWARVAGSASLVIEGAAAPDRPVEIFASAQSSRFPFVAMTGIERDRVLAQPRTLRDALIGGGAVATVLIIGLLLLIREQFNEKAEERAQRELQALTMREASAGILIADRTRRGAPIIEVNPAFEQLTGFSATEVMGRGLGFLISPETSPEASLALHQAIQQGEQRTVTIRTQRRDGRAFWNEVKLSVNRSAKGEVLHAVCVLNDVSDRIQASAQLREAKEEAEAAAQAKSSFVAHVSHEFRTPLNAIVGYAELFATEFYGPLENAKYKESAFAIRDNARHLMMLVNNVIDLYRLETDHYPIDVQPISVLDILDEAVTMVGDLARRSEVAIDRRAPAAPLPLIAADPLALRQVLINLLGNAIKFTPPGGRIDITASPLQETAGPGGPSVALTVHDSGPGMTAEDIARIGRPFAVVGRADPDYRRKKGAGLGLAIAKALTERLGGELRIQSDPGAGTAITVIVPPAALAFPIGLPMAGPR